jgi:hypothetical protein
MMKLLGIALLSIASLAVFASMVLPVMPFLVLGLGIEIPSFWARIGKPHFILLYPWVSLLVGVLLLAVLGWGIWKLARG